MSADHDTRQVDDERVRAALPEAAYDAVLGRPDEIVAMFVEAAPSPDELEWAGTATAILSRPGTGVIYDLDRQAVRMTSALESSTASIAASLARADQGAGRPVIRNPVQMVAELVHAAADTEILYGADDWVWGPAGPPYRGGEEERGRDDGRHVHHVHAERCSVDLDGCYEILDAWAGESADAFLNALEHQKGLLASTQLAADGARAAYRAAYADAASEQSPPRAARALAEPGWGVVAALAEATSLRLEAARSALNARLLTEAGAHIEIIGWGIIHGEARLRVLRDQWFGDAPSGRWRSGRPFGEWFDHLDGGLPAYWLAAYLASGMELARALGGERGVVAGALLGREPMFL